jgi:hypothetical protein
MAPKVINPFVKKKRKSNNPPGESSKTIKDLYYYLGIGYSSDSKFLHQNQLSSQENPQVQDPGNVSTQNRLKHYLGPLPV